VADEPVSLHLLFVMPRPKVPQFDQPAVKPDLSKLVRAVEDALQDAALYTNDSRIVELHARKEFEAGAGCGVVVTLTKGVK
jgi:Holliday junction resolvase RusA-like endonuclease